MGNIPQATLILRLLHVANLETCIRRGGLHAPNHMPADGLPWHVTHDVEVQERRSRIKVPCGPGGTIHDYVPFYFGERPPMLFQLKTGRVPGYGEGQEPLVYLVSSVETVSDAGLRFVFTDGHASAAFTQWFDAPKDLARVDWTAVRATYWGRPNDPTGELQRKKQAEFLVYGSVSWRLIRGIAVLDDERRAAVLRILEAHRIDLPVKVRPAWYY